jgi:ribosomal protein S18 acetylase RimI-like enzyme
MRGKIQRIKSIKDVLNIVRATMPDDVFESAEALEDSDKRNLWGFYVKDQLIGCSGYYYEDGKYFISWTAVRPENQGKGVGQRLITYVLEEIKKHGGTRVGVETYENPMFFNAIMLYLKNGFRLCGFKQNYLRDGSTILYLAREL